MTWAGLLSSEVFGVAATLGVYFGAWRLYHRWPIFLLNPVLVSIVCLIALLKILGLDYSDYNRGGRIISFFLGPAVVALGVVLHRKWDMLRAKWRSLAVSILAGSAVGICSAAGTAAWLGATDQAVASIIPKSVTTPIAMGIAAKLGGIEPLTAGLVVSAGVLGAVLGPPFLRVLGVRDSLAFGLAMGAAAHGIGTARALEEGGTQGAGASLAICLNGLATALLAPPLLWLLRLVMAG